MGSVLQALTNPKALRGEKLFVLFLTLYFGARMLALLVSYIVLKRCGALDCCVDRAWFLRRARRPLTLLLFVLLAFPFFD